MLHQRRTAKVSRGSSLIIDGFFQVFSEYSVPRWDDNRYGALRLRLACETNQRLRFGRFDVAKLLDLFAFARCDIREFLRAPKHANPTRSTRRRAAFNRNRSLDPARIHLAPVA